ncbi:MAG: hypothetical protein ACI3W5_10870 [Faecousia sp.]
MEMYLIAAGLLLNSALITINRFWKHIPDKFYLPGLILGIVLILTGAILHRWA